MGWLYFIAGMLAGGTVGVFMMCLCIIAGDAERRERERRERRA